jgi:RNA polymerase sigma-70 factor (ECF subfamily)
MSADPDLEFVESALRGDDDAFEELVRRYQRPIFALVIRICSSVDEAPDIVQRVFLKAYTKLRGFRRRSTFKTWLYTIAINLCRNVLRTRKRRGIHEEVDDKAVSVEAGIDEELISSERKEMLGRAVEELPPKQKAVLTLRVYEEMSFREIADTMRMTENSAKVNFHHAVRRLQAAIGNR